MHGWSPDGKFLVFCGERNKEYDVYRIPAAGGPEERLTNTPAWMMAPNTHPMASIFTLTRYARA
jgi:TolB protein